MGKKMKAIGCDILALSRFYKTLDAYDEVTLAYLYTAHEFKLAKESLEMQLNLAICFSGKEAVSKALGHGMAEISWNHIEILPNESGSAQVNTYEKAQQLAESLSIGQWELVWKVADKFLFVIVDAS